MAKANVVINTMVTPNSNVGVKMELKRGTLNYIQQADPVLAAQLSWAGKCRDFTLHTLL